MAEGEEQVDIESLVSSLFMLGVEHPDKLGHIEDFGPGSVILTLRLFQANRQLIEEPEKLEALCQAIHALPTRPLIGIDHEGGYIQYVVAWAPRSVGVPGLICKLIKHLIPPNFTLIPPAALIGKNADESKAEELGRIIGWELRAVGIDWNFAPVADVSYHPKYHFRHIMRTFADHEDEVAKFASLITRGMQEQGVIACPKHYPGMGRAAADSHMALPQIDDVDRDTLAKTDNVPFRACIEAGARSIMTNHALYPKIDANNVATLSPILLKDILKSEMGFEGVVLTDDMGMRGVREHATLSDAEIAVEALKAGCDVLMYSFRVERAIAARDAILAAIEKGDLSMKIVKKAARRMKKLKKWLAEVRAGLPELTAADLPNIAAKHKEISRSIMEGDTSFNRIGVTPASTVGSDAVGLEQQKQKQSCATM